MTVFLNLEKAKIRTNLEYKFQSKENKNEIAFKRKNHSKR